MGQARGCGNKMTVWVSRGYSGKEVTVKCGSTDQYGGQHLCDTCEKLPDPNYCAKCGDFVGDAFGPDYICACG